MSESTKLQITRYSRICGPVSGEYSRYGYGFFPDQSPANISKTKKYSGFVIQNVRSQKVTARFW